MAQLLNFETGQVEDVDDAQATAAVASGGYGLPRGRVNAFDPDGKLVSIDAEEAPEAFSKWGYRLESSAEAQQRRDAEEYGNREVAAGVAGFARGATFGISDLVAPALDVASPEELSKLKQYNPNISTGAEIGGAVASALLPGGPVATVGKAGRAVGALATAGAKGAAAKVASTAIAGAVEGGFFGAGQALSDAVLGDHEVTGEYLLAGAAKGALLGGGLGAALGGVGVAAEKGRAALLNKAQRGLAAADDKAKALARDVVEEEVKSAKGDYGAEVQKGSRQLENLIRLRDDVTPEMRQQIDDILGSDEGKRLIEGVVGNTLEAAPGQLGAISSKRAAFETLASGADDAIAARAAAIASPREAFNQVKARAARYGAPAIGRIVGGAAGGIVGGPVGIAGGALVGDLAGSLAGGQLRPSLHALKRMAQHPAVGKAFWGAVKKTAEATPEAFGAYTGVLQSAASKGATSLWATHAALAQNDPAYRETMARAGFAEETPEQVALVERNSQSLAAIQSLVAAQNKKIDTAIGRFLGTQPGAKPKTEPAQTRAERKENLARVTRRLDELANNPDILAQVIAPGSGISEAAPNVATSTAAAAARAVQFLSSKLPRNPDVQPIRALERPWEPTDGELTRFERYVRAIENPRSVLSDLSMGAVAQESIEALRAVYPRVYDDLKARMLERLAQHSAPLSFQQRTALSALLGSDMGDSRRRARAAVIRQVQQGAAAQEAQAQAAKGNAKLSTNLATEGQRLEGRRS